MSQYKSIGFIGLGVMGEPICRNLVKKSGARVTAFDLSPEPLKRLREEGVVVAASVAAPSFRVQRRLPPSRRSHASAGRSWARIKWAPVLRARSCRLPPERSIRASDPARRFLRARRLRRLRRGLYGAQRVQVLREARLRRREQRTNKDGAGF